MLLDLDLPGLNGHAVLRTLQAHKVLERTRVLVLSVHASDEAVCASFDAGADDHVVKPVSVPVLLRRMRRSLRRST